MEKTFRLEFKESTQQLRLDNGTHEPNTNGWVTIVEHISDKEFKLLKSVLDLVKHEKMTKLYLEELTNDLEVLIFNWLK